MDRLARLRLQGSAAAECPGDNDGRFSVSGLGSGDSSLLVGLELPQTLPTQPRAAVMALKAELQHTLKAGNPDAWPEACGPRPAGTAGYAAAIVTSVSVDGTFPLYRYPAVGGTARLVASQVRCYFLVFVPTIREIREFYREM
eukprot:SAG31_NODE_4468_length_3208_cov_2.629141_4_plen_143_part_00